jgi:hypothetical protein
MVGGLIMPQLTVRLSEDMADRIAERSGETGEYETKIEAVRELIRQGERLEEAEQERDRLREQLVAQSARIDDVEELLEYLKQERGVRERERERRRAPIWERAKWWVLGEPADDDAYSVRASRL